MTDYNNQPIFKTSLTLFEVFIGFVLFIFGFCLFLYFLLNLQKGELGFQLFVLIFSLILLIQAIRTTKTFLIFDDKIVIRRPLTLTNKTDVVFKLDDLKEIIFRNIKGRFGGPHLIVISNKNTISYRINSDKEVINEFINTLNRKGIKITNDNI